MELTEHDFIRIIQQGMIANFEEHGHLYPMLFILQDGQLIATRIPANSFASIHSKSQLSYLIRKVSAVPGVSCVAMVTEAYGVKVEKENPFSQLITQGTLRVSELSEKDDLIILFASSQTREQMIAYVVDSQQKKVIKPFGDPSGQLSGTFSHLFDNRKN